MRKLVLVAVLLFLTIEPELALIQNTNNTIQPPLMTTATARNNNNTVVPEDNFVRVVLGINPSTTKLGGGGEQQQHQEQQQQQQHQEQQQQQQQEQQQHQEQQFVQVPVFSDQQTKQQREDIVSGLVIEKEISISCDGDACASDILSTRGMRYWIAHWIGWILFAGAIYVAKHNTYTWINYVKAVLAGFGLFDNVPTIQDQAALKKKKVAEKEQEATDAQQQQATGSNLAQQEAEITDDDEERNKAPKPKQKHKKKQSQEQDLEAETEPEKAQKSEPEKANKESWVPAPIAWMRKKDDKFKMNMMSAAAGSVSVSTKWLQESNGMSPMTAQIIFSQFLSNMLGLFGDLAVTGRLKWSLFTPKFAVMFGMFVTVIWLDFVVSMACVLSLLDIMLSKSGTKVSPTTRGMVSLFIGIITQQFYINTLRSQWVYPMNLDIHGHKDNRKSQLIFAFVLIETLFYFWLVIDYNDAIVNQICVTEWNRNVGQPLCETAQQSEFLMCSYFCTDRVADQPICQNLNLAKDYCPAGEVAKRNYGYDVATVAIIGLFTFLTFGGLIPGNPISFSIVARAKEEEGVGAVDQPEKQKKKKKHDKDSGNTPGQSA